MQDKSESQQIDDIITAHNGWKGKTLSQLRAAIRQADPAVVEEIKWRMRSRPEGLPVWTHDGIVCFAETWKDNIKLLFPKGAQMESLQHHFNARLNSSKDRAIEFREGGEVDVPAIKEIVLEAIRLNEVKAGRLSL